MTSFRLDVRPCYERRYIAMALESVDNSIDGGGPDPGPKNNNKETRVRKDFPETWLWLDEKLSSDGKKEIEVTVPDTITSWYASAFAVSKSAGLGIANAANLRVFQPFFLSINLPYSIVRGEEVTVPAAVFSYLEDACISVKVTLAYSADYHMVAGPAAKACICGGRTATILFRIIPRNLGKIPLRITAETLESNICAAGKKVAQSISTADIVVRKLLVEPEGVKNSYTLSSFICPKDSPVSYFKLRRPQNLVPGSVYSKVSVIGDIMGSSLSNIDELLAMPYGCGEQNMLKFAPNIFIMNYLNNTNQVSGEIKTKALDYMRSGYQRELTYKHKDGSYSAFGERDKSGSTWLSAFVLKSYAQARPWIDVDEKEIAHTSKWLQGLQAPDGCFLKVGSLHSKAMAGGVKSPVTLTAYIVISLLEADVSPKNKKIINAAYNCVAKEFKSVTDSYSLSIMAYMYAMLEDNMMYERIMDKLDKLAVVEDGIKHWEEKKEKDDEKDDEPWYYQARSTDIEQTAYVLLAVLEHEGKKGISDAVPIVRWLSKQRNDLGGWSSTQDTVLAMQALSAFAELSFGASLSMNIDISGDDSFQHSFKIHSNNNLVLQEVEDIPVPGSLKVDAKGDGCALVQAIVRYNEKKVLTKPSFAINVKHTTHKFGKLTSLQKCYPQMVTICAKWLRPGVSNMAIIDVAMVSGFEADDDFLEKVQSRSRLGLKDIEIKGKNVFFYFNKIGRGDTCIDFLVRQTAVVDKLKEVPVKVYDYYDTEKSATTMYTFSKEDCLGNKVDTP